MILVFYLVDGLVYDVSIWFWSMIWYMKLVYDLGI